MDSCLHAQCQEVANRAARLASGDPGGSGFVDLARVEPGLRPFSVDCTMVDAVVYMRDVDGGRVRFWMLRLSEVLDPDLVRKLEEARIADEPMAM